jgi:hypothetical protein
LLSKDVVKKIVSVQQVACLPLFLLYGPLIWDVGRELTSSGCKLGVAGGAAPVYLGG